MARRKYGACPECCPNGGAIFDREWDFSQKDENGEYPVVWRCCNCGYTKPMRKTPARPTEPTKAQLKMIESLKAAIVRSKSYSGNKDDYEFKKCEWTFNAEFGTIFMVTEYGRKNDEGTLGSITRDHRCFHIGPKGGVELLNPKDKKLQNRSSRPKGVFNCVNVVVM